METEEMREVTAFASLAPSVHNSQPWYFVAAGHTLEVWADTTRQLPYLDPSARQLHVSCGAAVEFARLAIRSLGYQCTVRLAPRCDDPQLMATLTIGQQLPVSPEEKRLVEAAPRRYTDRGPYSDRLVPPALLRRVREVVEERGCWLRVLDAPRDRTAATVLLGIAQAAEDADPRYLDELSRWRRDETATDGVPVASSRWTDESRVPDVPLRDFAGVGPVASIGGTSLPPSVERDTLVLVGTDGDDPLSWLRAGRAIAALMLELTAAGATCQPLGPVTDLPEPRRRLQRELGLIGHPQMLLRTGYGDAAPTTGRRRVDDVLTATAV